MKNFLRPIITILVCAILAYWCFTWSIATILSLSVVLFHIFLFLLGLFFVFLSVGTICFLIFKGGKR